METREAAAERKEGIEQRASRDVMRLLTAGLTHEGDTFLIASGAVLLLVVLFLVIGGWALLAFPFVTVAAVLTRSKLRKRRDAVR